jgi:hypothetical protein
LGRVKPKAIGFTGIRAHARQNSIPILVKPATIGFTKHKDLHVFYFFFYSVIPSRYHEQKKTGFSDGLLDPKRGTRHI